MPSFIPPMLPTLVNEPPDGEDWQHEIKHDGYRTQLHLSRHGSRAFTRNGYDWSDRYRLLLECANELASHAILDGEVIVQDEQGRSAFHDLRTAIASSPEQLIFYAFDLLWLDGRDLRREPLEERRTKLVQLVGSHNPESRVQYSEAVLGGGPEFFGRVAELELEGIVSKKITSRYSSGRTLQWVKVKAFAEAEFSVIGWEPPSRGPAVALLAKQTDEGLRYAGGAFVTLSSGERERFWRLMDALRVSEPAVDTARPRKATWVRPEVKVTAKFLRGEQNLRHATVCQIIES